MSGSVVPTQANYPTREQTAVLRLGLEASKPASSAARVAGQDRSERWAVTPGAWLSPRATTVLLSACALSASSASQHTRSWPGIRSRMARSGRSWAARCGTVAQSAVVRTGSRDHPAPSASDAERPRHDWRRARGFCLSSIASPSRRRRRCSHRPRPRWTGRLRSRGGRPARGRTCRRAGFKLQVRLAGYAPAYVHAESTRSFVA